MGSSTLPLGISAGLAEQKILAVDIHYSVLQLKLPLVLDSCDL
jgi:hypothetical protein